MPNLAANNPARPGRHHAWKMVTVADLADLKITYGTLDENLPDHQGIVRAGDIRDGRITTSQPGRIGAAGPKDTRAALQEGDLVVVLVRRVGDAALVTEQHKGWIATRAVGIVRSQDPDITHWLRIWFRTPAGQGWINQQVSAHVEPTLSLDALRKMRVAFPPPEQIRAIHELVTLIARKVELNHQIVATAIALADAHYATWTRQRESWTPTTFGKVTHARTGKSVPPAFPDDGGVDVARVSPADIFKASLPYIDQTVRRECVDPGVVCEPGTILVAPRPGEARTAVALEPTAPCRGMLAVRPVDATDLWWLLHELRSRSIQLPEAAQGSHAREITRRAFSRLHVAWPGPDVRRQFFRVAKPLHDRARAALAENRSLNVLLDMLLRDISSASGSFFGRTDPV
ncbi:hypothetical protein [Embleya sp. NBC_00896]|uniref:hypothetical protein n=1 Tax=Embleya sp. NBC_00896 TaxID=2975961 RepID=UPI00386719B5|nr:hypothetical protein OG928_18300 [Embleya sp. NBC_00896]